MYDVHEDRPNDFIVLDDDKFAKLISMLQLNFTFVRGNQEIVAILKAQFLESLENEGLFTIEVDQMAEPRE